MTEAEMKALMARIRDRKRYSSFTPDILAGIADADLVLAILDHLQDHVLIGGVTNAMRAYQELGVGLRSIYATDILDGQVRNGGFAQFFFNRSGRHAPDALEGLQRIGARQRSAIVQQAMDLFLREQGPMLRTVDGGDRLAAYSDFAKQIDFSSLDSAYYKLDANENLRALQVAYIRAHTFEFVTR